MWAIIIEVEAVPAGGPGGAGWCVWVMMERRGGLASGSSDSRVPRRQASRRSQEEWAASAQATAILQSASNLDLQDTVQDIKPPLCRGVKLHWIF